MFMQWNYLCLIVQYLSATSQILSRVMSSWSGWRGHSGKIAVLNNSWSTWDLLHQLPIISPQGFCTSWSWFTRSAGGMHELHVHLGCLKASRTSNFHRDYPCYLDDWTIEWLDDDDDEQWPLHGYYRCFCITSISRLTPLQQQRIQVHVARFGTWMLRNRCCRRGWDLILEYLRSSNLHRSHEIHLKTI